MSSSFEPYADDDVDDFSLAVRIPIEPEGEESLFQQEAFHFSFRQMVGVLMSLVPWALAAQVTQLFFSVIGIGLSTFWAYAFWFIIPLSTAYVMLRTKNGRPYEYYLADRVLFILSPRRYIVQARQATTRTIEDADWRDI